MVLGARVAHTAKLRFNPLAAHTCRSGAPLSFGHALLSTDMCGIGNLVCTLQSRHKLLESASWEVPQAHAIRSRIVLLSSPVLTLSPALDAPPHVGGPGAARGCGPS